MLKRLPFPICLGLLLLACGPDNESSKGIDRVITIQESIATKPLDSLYEELKMAEQILAQVKNVPDSLNAENNYLLGSYFKEKGITDSAVVYFHNATNFVNDSVYKERQGEYFQAAFNASSRLGQYGDCFIISKKFKSLLNPDKDYRTLSWAYHWEYRVYIMMKDYEKALEINKLQIELAQEKDPSNLPAAKVERAKINYYYLKNKREAFAILDSLIAHDEKLTPNFQSQVYGYYGVYQYYDGDFNGALKNYLKALAAAKRDTGRADYENALATSFNNIAEVSMDLGQYESVRTYLDSVKRLGMSNLERRAQRSLMRYELRLATETQKGLKEVYAILDSINANQDIAYNDKLDKELLALTKKTEEQKILTQEKQAAEIKNIKLETRNLLLLISAGLLGVIGFLFFQRRKLKFEKQTLQNQQRLLRSQMNPHFTFNTLYAIQNEMKKDQKGASDHLLKFSRLLRLILENSTQNYVQLEKELEALNKYLDLQALRMASNFNYKIQLKNMEEDELVFIPPMLLQPFVENSIEHGFAGIDYPGEINVILSKQRKFIHCTIEDNGIGISDHGNDLKNSASVRLISDFLAKATKSKVNISNKAHHNEDETGVIVEFLIPYRLTEND